MAEVVTLRLSDNRARQAKDIAAAAHWRVDYRFKNILGIIATYETFVYGE